MDDLESDVDAAEDVALVDTPFCCCCRFSAHEDTATAGRATNANVGHSNSDSKHGNAIERTSTEFTIVGDIWTATVIPPSE